MNEWTDQELLRDYAERQSERAFSELVRRHIDLVYSAALRMVCDSHLAQDVTQNSFMALAQNARHLTNRPVLSGWLHRTAQNLASKTVRTDVRRRAREQEAATMNELLAESGTDVPPDWSKIAPHLDAALGALSEPDRDALLLRYFERKSAREMAQTLGISDEAAQKRVHRAVERLRELIARRGTTIGASGLTLIISINAVQAAPLGLAATITAAAAVGGTAVALTTTAAVTKAIAMTTLQKTIVGTAFAAAVATGIYEARQAANARDEVKSLQQQQAPLTEQLTQLTHERDRARRETAELRDETARSKSNTSELMKVRGENVRLRDSARELAQMKTAANDPLEGTVKSWATRATLLRQRLKQNPNEMIPEIGLLTDADWLEAMRGVQRLESDGDFRQATGLVRDRAKDKLVEVTRKAIQKYADANGGMLPTTFAELKSYYESPPEDAVFQRYELRQRGKLNEVPKNEFLFGETAPHVDVEYDKIYQFSMNSKRTTGVAGSLVLDATIQFAQANNDLLPTSSSQLLPYLKQPMDPAKVQKIMSGIPPSITTLAQMKAAGLLK